MTQAWDESREDSALPELLQQLMKAHADGSVADAYAALRPRTGAITEAAVIDEVRALLVDIIPPDKRPHEAGFNAEPRFRQYSEH